MALTVAHVATPGLQNLTGEYNCFLNVIVQCLWHCRAFRSSLLRRLNPQQLQACSALPCLMEICISVLTLMLYERQLRQITVQAEQRCLAQQVGDTSDQSAPSAAYEVPFLKSRAPTLLPIGISID